MIILKRPIISEKSMMNARIGLYTFEVDKNATKFQIAKAVEEKFKVKVTAVKTINTKGQVKQQKSVRKSYQTPMIRKALVKLQKGQILAIFETPKEDVVVTTAEGESIVIKEKKDMFKGTKVKIEKSQTAEKTAVQRKVITGK